MSNTLLMRRRALLGTKKEPGWDGRIWAYYDVDDISSPTRIIGYNTNFGVTSLEIDGSNIPMTSYDAYTYQFNKTGKHLVKIELRDKTNALFSFEYCRTLTEVYFPEGITDFKCSLYGCSNLLDIYLPTSLINCYLGNGDYQDDNYVNLYFNFHIKDLYSFLQINYTKKDGNFLKHATHFFINDVDTTELHVPSQLTKIKDYTFSYTKIITDIYIPSSITEVGIVGFGNCTANLHFDDDPIELTLGNGAFDSSKAAGELVVLNESSPSISSVRFNIIRFPFITRMNGEIAVINYNELFEFGENLREFSNVISLYSANINAKFVFKSTTPPICSGSPFAWEIGNRKIYVPYSVDHSILNAYKTTQYWSDYANNIFELDENGEIPE